MVSIHVTQSKTVPWHKVGNYPSTTIQELQVFTQLNWEIVDQLFEA